MEIIELVAKNDGQFAKAIFVTIFVAALRRDVR